MRLILVGPPGSGKGTQAKLLSERLGLAHIGTGDILREAGRRGTPLGKLADPFVKSGRLVPDHLVNELVAETFRRDDRPDRFVMDGYPRTLAQAAAFDALLRQHFLNLCAALVLVVEDDEIVRRLSGRWGCPRCQATYHVAMKPPRVAGICDVCGAALVQRDDDREETVRQRLRVYHQNTEGLIPHYRAQGILHEVRGVGSIDAVNATIMEALKQAGSSC